MVSIQRKFLRVLDLVLDSGTVDTVYIVMHGKFTHFYIGLRDFTRLLHTLTPEVANL